MSVEVNLGEVNLVFDPYVKPDEPRFKYIFVGASGFVVGFLMDSHRSHIVGPR